VFNLSGSEIIFLILIALVVLGPDKLPEAMRKAGKAYGDFKRMTSGFQNEMKSVLDEPMRELRETADLAKTSAMFDTSAITKPLSGLMADVKSAATGNMPAKPAEPVVQPAATVAVTPAAAPVQTPVVDSVAEPAAEAVVEPAAEFVAAPVVSAVPTPRPAADFPAVTPAPAAGDATSRRLARMQQTTLGADGAPSAAEPAPVESAPAEGASVE
jgi:sec-independent protein translocase protein TatB